jgi:hypothetical protein
MDLKKNLYNDLDELSKVWDKISEEMQDVIAKAVVGERCDYLLCRLMASMKNLNEDYSEVEAAINNIEIK